MDMNDSLKHNMLAAGKSLAIFAIIASALVGITFELTKNKIADNERLALLKNLHQLVTPDMHDNDLYRDKTSLSIPQLNYRGTPVVVYRARKNNRPVAAIFNVIAPDGYSGPIKLLVAIRANGSLIGVRAISHKETPGLGDGIDIEKSDWIRIFDNRNLSNPEEKRWHVKKDGGDFDQLTGATITPRAVVKMVYKTLKYYTRHQAEVFAPLEGEQHVQ